MGSTGSFDCAVIGGGVMGCSTALHLARAGMRVALIERGGLCREASGTNAGTLTLQMTRAALMPYALKGFEMWRTTSDWLGMDVGTRVLDGLSLAFTEAQAEMLESRAQSRREAGAPIEIIGPERARTIEPGLSDRVLLAAYCPVDGFAVAYLTGLAFRQALLASGVALRENQRVHTVDAGDDGFRVRFTSAALHAKRIVLAGGVWLEEMIPWLGLHIPVQCLANQLLITERVAPVMRTILGVANGKLSLKQFDNGTVLVGGGWQGKGNLDRGGAELVPRNVIGNLMLAGYAIPSLKTARIVR
ncbi:MAG: NAD(P)/FAD-dependent oxidoreductase, partial [Gammaproteobacteria bacterium]